MWLPGRTRGFAGPPDTRDVQFPGEPSFSGREPLIAAPQGRVHVRGLGMRRSCSAPVLALDQDWNRGVDIWVGTRPFLEWGRTLPQPVKNVAYHLGICHYYIIIKSADGTLSKFDFGPVGRDVALTRKGKGKQGEIREEKLLGVPSSCMYVGRSQLSLGDIRSYNSLQQTLYELQKNDCRHYVNNVVRYACQVDSVTGAAMRHTFLQRKKRLTPADRLLQLGHYATDLNNWPRVRAAGQATLAALAGMMGRRSLVHLRPQLLPALQPIRSTAISRAVALPRRKILHAATAATATYAASLGETSVLSQVLSMGARVGDGVKGAALSVAGVTESLGRNSSQAGNAAAAGAALCGAATRGAAGLMTTSSSSQAAQQPQPGYQRALPFSRKPLKVLQLIPAGGGRSG